MDIHEIRLQNLRCVMKKEPTAAEFASRVGSSASTISQYLSAKTKRALGDTLARRIEATYGLPRGWMDMAHPEEWDGSVTVIAGSELAPASIGQRQVPIINHVQAGSWKEIRQDFQTQELLLTDLELSQYAFALVIQGESMLPEFRPGDRVIIDPDVFPAPGDCVVAINGGNEATFKKYRERGINADGKAVFELVPLNPDYPTLRSDLEHIEIIGTMMEHRKYRRR